VEWSIVLLVGAVGGPVAWKAYLIVLLLPYTLCFALWRDGARPPGVRRAAGLVLLAGLLFTTLPTVDLLGKRIARSLEMASVFTIGAVLILVGLFVLHARLPAAER
jgi:phosphatidylserine synthase